MSDDCLVLAFKVCTACDQNLPLTKFKKRSSKGRQAGQRASMCNRCLYERYSKPLVVARTAEVQAFKVAAGCTDCGYDKHPAALHFDHLPGSKKLFNIGEQIGNYGMDKIWAEIAKCEVVCANCHAIRTTTRREDVRLAELAG